MPVPEKPPENIEIPDPELLIKSLAEQGYSLETSLADLIDNAITAAADQIEILVDTEQEPFILFMADNGNGMDKDSLTKNMRFPSSSPESRRHQHDLGRFGLGMKTASFSQTRILTVISRKKGTDKYYGRTWDVNHLQREKKWQTLEPEPEALKDLLNTYSTLSKSFLNAFSNFTPNTIIIWQGLYKFENYLEDRNRRTALRTEISEITSEYLSLVFHRYMEKKSSPLSLRVNNNILTPFNPFPTDENDFRRLESNQKIFRSDSLRIEGYILPARALEESRNGHSVWTQKDRSLTDMEGLYIYRADRIILFGGWNGIIKKSPRLQLARLKVDIGNGVDHFFHLNVAKSSIVIPYELKRAFLRYISQLKTEAEKEYYNKGVKTITRTGKRSRDKMFVRHPSSKGMVTRVNLDFPLISGLTAELSEEQRRDFRAIIRMVNIALDRVLRVHEDKPFAALDDGLDEQQLINIIQRLKASGMSPEEIETTIVTGLGLIKESIPQRIFDILT